MMQIDLTEYLYDPTVEREETHPVCMMNGIIASTRTRFNVSGCDYIQVDEEEDPLKAELSCSVCGHRSK